MKNLILRFRDSDSNDTISEHLNCIQKHGYTWWGWWKKSNEPFRGAEFLDIQSRTSDYVVFLFDRSSDRFFRVTLQSVVFRDNELIESPDKTKTPDYYSFRELAAWFKLAAITVISKEDFLERIGFIPSFDYSIFTMADLDNERASVTNRIRLRSHHILHLSDIHLGSDYGFPARSVLGSRSLEDRIRDFVTNDFSEKFGLLVISGDIISKAEGNVLINQAIQFVNDLCDILDLDKSNVIIVPGNHDIPLNTADPVTYDHEKTFKYFLKELYGRPMDLYGIELFELPDGAYLDILRIHSVRLRKKEESNYGYVDWLLYKNLLSSKPLDGNIKMAILHHHLVSVPIEEKLDTSYPYGSISVTIDSGRVIEGLQKAGIKLVLNGHQHIPGITKIARGTPNASNEITDIDTNNIYILSAGSAGVVNSRFSDEFKYNSFSIYTIYRNEITIEAKKYNPIIEPQRHFRSVISL